jgi:glycosyltransferase involved in cell wall biosynthesis
VAEPFSIVCLSPQDWQADLPTNRQQIMRRAARRGHAVLFVETGYFSGRQIWRLLQAEGVRSLRRVLRAEKADEKGVRVCKAANVLPWGQRFELAGRVNAALTARRVRRLAGDLPAPHILWVYDPCASGVIGHGGEIFAVYDCVDDYGWHSSAGRRRQLVEAGDADAARRSRLVFATTPALAERQRVRNRATHLVPNVGDFDHFSRATDREHAAVDVQALATPVLGFAGNFLATKVDLDLLDAIARARPDWTLLLVGPARPGTGRRLAELGRLPNVLWVGPKSYRELPQYVAAFDVGLIPYVRNGYTASCFPLKLYEYLAAGKPVVATGVPVLEGMEPDVRLVDGPQAFVEAVEAALALRSEDDRARRTDLASRNTWETRAERLLALIVDELAESEPVAA